MQSFAIIESQRTPKALFGGDRLGSFAMGSAWTTAVGTLMDCKQTTILPGRPREKARDRSKPRAPNVPGRPQKSSESGPMRDRIAELGGQRMWLDLLVASGLGLPAIVYGSVLFVHYLQ